MSKPTWGDAEFGPQMAGMNIAWLVEEDMQWRNGMVEVYAADKGDRDPRAALKLRSGRVAQEWDTLETASEIFAMYSNRFRQSVWVDAVSDVWAARLSSEVKVLSATSSAGTQNYVVLAGPPEFQPVLRPGDRLLFGSEPESLNRQVLDERRKQEQAAAREQSRLGKRKRSESLPNSKEPNKFRSERDKSSPGRASGVGAMSSVLASESAHAAGSHDGKGKGRETEGTNNLDEISSNTAADKSGRSDPAVRSKALALLSGSPAVRSKALALLSGSPAVRSKALALLSGSSDGHSPSKAPAVPTRKEVTQAQAVPGKQEVQSMQMTRALAGQEARPASKGVQSLQVVPQSGPAPSSSSSSSSSSKLHTVIELSSDSESGTNSDSESESDSDVEIASVQQTTKGAGSGSAAVAASSLAAASPVALRPSIMPKASVAMDGDGPSIGPVHAADMAAGGGAGTGAGALNDAVYGHHDDGEDVDVDATSGGASKASSPAPTSGGASKASSPAPTSGGASKASSPVPTSGGASKASSPAPTRGGAPTGSVDGGGKAGSASKKPLDGHMAAAKLVSVGHVPAGAIRSVPSAAQVPTSVRPSPLQPSASAAALSPATARKPADKELIAAGQAVSPDGRSTKAGSGGSNARNHGIAAHRAQSGARGKMSRGSAEDVPVMDSDDDEYIDPRCGPQPVVQCTIERLYRMYIPHKLGKTKSPSRSKELAGVAGARWAQDEDDEDYTIGSKAQGVSSPSSSGGMRKGSNSGRPAPAPASSRAAQAETPRRQSPGRSKHKAWKKQEGTWLQVLKLDEAPADSVWSSSNPAVYWQKEHQLPCPWIPVAPPGSGDADDQLRMRIAMKQSSDESALRKDKTGEVKRGFEAQADARRRRRRSLRLFFERGVPNVAPMMTVVGPNSGKAGDGRHGDDRPPPFCRDVAMPSVRLRPLLKRALVQLPGWDLGKATASLSSKSYPMFAGSPARAKGKQARADAGTGAGARAGAGAGAVAKSSTARSSGDTKTIGAEKAGSGLPSSSMKPAQLVKAVAAASRSEDRSLSSTGSEGNGNQDALPAGSALRPSSISSSLPSLTSSSSSSSSSKVSRPAQPSGQVPMQQDEPEDKSPAPRMGQAPAPRAASVPAANAVKVQAPSAGVTGPKTSPRVSQPVEGLGQARPYGQLELKASQGPAGRPGSAKTGSETDKEVLPDSAKIGPDAMVPQRHASAAHPQPGLLRINGAGERPDSVIARQSSLLEYAGELDVSPPVKKKPRIVPSSKCSDSSRVPETTADARSLQETAKVRSAEPGQPGVPRHGSSSGGVVAQMSTSQEAPAAIGSKRPRSSEAKHAPPSERGAAPRPSSATAAQEALGPESTSSAPTSTAATGGLSTASGALAPAAAGRASGTIPAATKASHPGLSEPPAAPSDSPIDHHGRAGLQAASTSAGLRMGSASLLRLVCPRVASTTTTAGVACDAAKAGTTQPEVPAKVPVRKYDASKQHTSSGGEKSQIPSSQFANYGVGSAAQGSNFGSGLGLESEQLRGMRSEKQSTENKESSSAAGTGGGMSSKVSLVQTGDPGAEAGSSEQMIGRPPASQAAMLPKGIGHLDRAGAQASRLGSGAAAAASSIAPASAARANGTVSSVSSGTVPGIKGPSAAAPTVSLGAHTRASHTSPTKKPPRKSSSSSSASSAASPPTAKDKKLRTGAKHPTVFQQLKQHAKVFLLAAKTAVAPPLARRDMPNLRVWQKPSGPGGAASGALHGGTMPGMITSATAPNGEPLHGAVAQLYRVVCIKQEIKEALNRLRSPKGASQAAGVTSGPELRAIHSGCVELGRIDMGTLEAHGAGLLRADNLGLWQCFMSLRSLLKMRKLAKQLAERHDAMIASWQGASHGDGCPPPSMYECFLQACQTLQAWGQQLGLVSAEDEDKWRSTGGQPSSAGHQQREASGEMGMRGVPDAPAGSSAGWSSSGLAGSEMEF